MRKKWQKAVRRLLSLKLKEQSTAAEIAKVLGMSPRKLVRFMRAVGIEIRATDEWGFTQYAITLWQIIDMPLFTAGHASKLLGPGFKMIQSWIDRRLLKNIRALIPTNGPTEGDIHAKFAYRRTSLRELLRAASDLKSGLREPRPFDEELWTQLGVDQAHDPSSETGSKLITEAALQALKDLADGKIKLAVRRLKIIHELFDRSHFADTYRLVDCEGMRFALTMISFDVTRRFRTGPTATAQHMIEILWDLVECRSRKCFGDLCWETSCPLNETMWFNREIADMHLEDKREELRQLRRDLEQDRQDRQDRRDEEYYDRLRHRRGRRRRR